jgi:hypothetical protein
LIGFLQSEKVDVRVKAVKLVGRLFASRKGVSEKFDKLFSECLKRFNDKSVDVRLAMVESSKKCLLNNSSTNVAGELLSELIALHGIGIIFKGSSPF